MTQKKKKSEDTFQVEVLQGSEVPFFKLKTIDRREIDNLLILLDRASKQGVWYTMKVEIGKNG